MKEKGERRRKGGPLLLLFHKGKKKKKKDGRPWNTKTKSRKKKHIREP
jgi:hypothetical protein